MASHKFITPFAANGDKTPVPTTIQSDGSVSYPEGYGFNYSRNPATDPQAKNIERAGMNQLFYDVTQAVGEIQTHGFADWITAAENGGAAYAYDAGAVVRYGGANYQSLVAANTATPGTDAAKWQVLGTQPDATTAVKGVVRVATSAEAAAGTATNIAVDPAGVKAAIAAQVAITPDATTTTAGKIRVATTAEATAGTATNIAVDPVQLWLRPWEKLTNVTSATTLADSVWGGFVTVGGSSTYTTTLPSVRNGGRLVIFSYSSTDQTLSAQGAAKFYGRPFAFGASTFTIAAGQTVTLASNGIDYIILTSSGFSADAGSVSFFARNTPPSGWLQANGAAVSRTAYAALFAVVGTTYGAGDGSTTFNLPDLRGEFIRCLDGGRGVDAGRLLGSWQVDDFRSHIHELEAGYNNLEASTSPNINDVGRSGGTLSSGYNTRPAGGTETRPRNVALLACIKY